MATTNHQSDPPQPCLSAADPIYRCVCGKLIKMSFRQGAACPTCGRNYNLAVFNEKNTDETILVTQAPLAPPSFRLRRKIDRF